MLKEFVWKTFENTGNIDAYVFYKEIEGKNSLVKENTIIGKEPVNMSNQ